MSFRTHANLAKIINHQYVEGKLELREVTKLLSMDLKSLQREVFLMLPHQDKEDHAYLIYEEPKEPPIPHALYMGGKIDIAQYEDMMFPGKRVSKIVSYVISLLSLWCDVMRSIATLPQRRSKKEKLRR